MAMCIPADFRQCPICVGDRISLHNIGGMKLHYFKINGIRSAATSAARQAVSYP